LIDDDDLAPPTPARASAEPRLRLDSLQRVRREMARLYVEGKRGKRDVSDVSKLAHVLALIGRIVEGSELERRLEELEQKVATKGKWR
jgi:hypothetical protein